MYVRDVKSGICDGSAVPFIVQSSPATALVDGNNGLGPVVGNFCMDIATKKARETGVGWVAAKGENYIIILFSNCTVFECESERFKSLWDCLLVQPSSSGKRINCKQKIVSLTIQNLIKKFLGTLFYKHVAIDEPNQS